MKHTTRPSAAPVAWLLLTPADRPTPRRGAPRVPLPLSYNSPERAAAIRAAVAAETVADRWLSARQHIQAVGFFHRRERGTN